MSDTDYYSVLRIKAFNDLANRAKPGIFIYAIVWFAIAFSLNLHESSPLFFQINSGLIVLIFITRLTHLFLRKQVDKHNVNFLEMWLTTSILLAALHWGLMSAWIFYDSELTNIEPPMLIVLA
ncbi:hypothetical protein, partial [Oleiphilus sp. HI0125]